MPAVTPPGKPNLRETGYKLKIVDINASLIIDKKVEGDNVMKWLQADINPTTRK